MDNLLAIKFSDLAPNIQHDVAPNIPITTSIAGLFTLSTGVNLINLVFFFIGFIFLINILIAAYEYISSNGDPQKIQKATIRLQNGLVGIAVTLASFGLVQLIASLIGIPGILF